MFLKVKIRIQKVLLLKLVDMMSTILIDSGRLFMTNFRLYYYPSLVEEIEHIKSRFSLSLFFLSVLKYLLIVMPSVDLFVCLFVSSISRLIRKPHHNR